MLTKEYSEEMKFDDVVYNFSNLRFNLKWFYLGMNDRLNRTMNDVYRCRNETSFPNTG